MEHLYAFSILDVIGLLVAYAFVVSLKMYPRMFRRYAAKRFQPDYAPRISMFIPCKGTDEFFEANIQTFMQQRYHNATLFFIVESQGDAAYPILRKHVKHAPDAYVVVAGLSNFCGQKNYNLLQGIKASEEQDDVYVFLDALTCLTAQQIQDLVRPLSDPKITASVGFRWNMLRNKTLGERLHAFMIGLQWSAMNCVFAKAIWGGATAIRREDFEKMGVREYWLKTVVDDMTLLQMMFQQKRKTIFVPTCVKETSGTVTTVGGAVCWFKRQALYLKYYLRPLWISLLALLAYAAANILCLPLIVTYALLFPGKKILAFAGAKTAFVLLLMICCRLMKRPTNDQHSGWSWFLFSPLYLVLSAWAVMLGTFTRVMRWRGIAYYLTFDGTVKRVARTE